VAKYLNAIPVITTATDIDHVPAIDMLAVKHGLLIENPEYQNGTHGPVARSKRSGP
jgi:hypothetical protein